MGDNKQHEQHEQAPQQRVEPERKQYQPPRLLRLGTIEEITQGNSFNAADAVAGFASV